MADNYDFLDAHSSVQTAEATDLGSDVYRPNVQASVHGTVGITGLQGSSVSGTVGASVIGTVPVNGVVPLTGATNLGKAIDTAAGGTDTGVAMLGKHKEDQVHLTTANDDYDVMTMDSLGSLHVNAEAHHVFDTFNATTGWSALNNDTDNIATTKKHVTGTDALTFDKVDGAANTVFAAIQKTLSSTDLGAVSHHDLIQGTFYIPDLTDVAYAFIRLGTDSSNYNEWQLPDTALTGGIFETGALSIGDADYDGITGNGWDPSAITYICVGVAFDNQNDTLSGIIFDEVSYHTNQHTAAILGAEVTSEVSTPNVNLQKVGGTATAKNSGALSNGTQRVVLATDSPATSISGTVDIGNTNVNVSGSVVSFVDSLQGASVSGTVDIGNTNVNVSGSVVAFVDSLQGASVSGTVDIGNTNVNVSGSVVGFQGTSPWVTNIQANSIVGTYAEDAAHTTADKGLFALGVRNDAVSSFVSADDDYTPLGLDSAGRVLNKPFAASESQVEGVASTVSTSVVAMVAAAGAGLRNYITDIQIANTGGSDTLISFSDGSESVLGHTIAPTLGGSNIQMATPMRTAANSAFTAQAVTASSVVYMTVRGYKAP